MAVSVHVARLGLYTVDAAGNRVDKSSADTSINTMKSTSLEFLIIPDATIANTANYPTIKTYLGLEASSGYILNHLDQSFIITYKTT